MAAKRGNPNWTKGKSGNPSGRPPVIAEIRDLARQHTEVALKALVTVVGSAKAPPAARVAAAQALLDRGYGKPVQHLEANINIIDKLSLDDRRALDLALASLAGSEGDAAGGGSALH